MTELPTAVDFAGRLWTLVEDGDPLASPIGYALACEYGTVIEPRDSALAGLDAIDLIKEEDR